MSRPGGNPDLVKYQFKSKGTAPLEKKLSVNLTAEMHQEVMKRGGSEFIRNDLQTRMKKLQAQLDRAKVIPLTQVKKSEDN